MAMPCGRLAVALAASLAIAQAKSAFAQSIIPIPADSGGNFMVPAAINNAGAVAGFYTIPHASMTNGMVYLPTNNATTDLGTNAGDPYYACFASSINNSGVIAGSYDGTSTGYQANGFTTQAGSGTLNLFTVSSTVHVGSAVINDAGTIVGQTYVGYNSGTPTPYYQTAGGSVTSIAIPSYASGALLNAINSAGLAAGLITNSSTTNNTLGVFNTSSPAAGLIDLGSPADSTITSGTKIGINAAGTIVSTSQNLDDSSSQGFIYTTATGFTALLPLGGTGNSTAEAIDSAGNIVGRSSVPGTSTDDAAVWLAGTTTAIDLNTLLPANSGWVLQDAVGINNKGQVIGTGSFNGVSEPFIFSTTLDAVASASGTWNASTSGNWETTTNWLNSVMASGAGQTATFADSIGTSSATVTLTASETVGVVAFTGTQGGKYTIAGSSTNALNLSNGSSVALVTVKSGSQTISAPIALANGLNVNTTSGSLTIGGAVTGTGSLTITTGSSLILSPTGTVSVPLVDSGSLVFSQQASGSTALIRTLPSLNLSAGATASIGIAPAGVGKQNLSIGALTLSGQTGAWTSKLDIGNNTVDAPGGSLASIFNQIKQGYNGGNWQGSGGITSSAAAADSNHVTAVGVMLGTAGDVLVKYTYYGDANLDGVVDGSDYTKIDAAYAADRTNPTAMTGWSNGDFNYDGTVDGSDYTLIDNAFNTQRASLASAFASPTVQTVAQTAAVPEPATMSFFCVLGWGLLGRRRKNHHASAEV